VHLYLDKLSGEALDMSSLGFPSADTFTLGLNLGMLLTPKFGKESDLWVRFEKESVWWKEGYF
jgi:hypothetical protein